MPDKLVQYSSDLSTTKSNWRINERATEMHKNCVYSIGIGQLFWSTVYNNERIGLLPKGKTWLSMNAFHFFVSVLPLHHLQLVSISILPGFVNTSLVDQIQKKCRGCIHFDSIRMRIRSVTVIFLPFYK